MQIRKIGVLGAGHIGKIHIKCILESKHFDLVGFHDPDPEIVSLVKKKFGIRHYESVDHLIDACQMVDIVTPTVSHYECAVKAFRKFKHVFIEKPLTTNLDEARALINLAREANVKVQVGHVERFNPAFLAAAPFLKTPMFVEAHRLANFKTRGTDVPVVLDLMIHDIDIVLHAVKSPVKKVLATGVSVVSETPDIANARVEFDNGCVANLTANRISLKNMRKTRFFQKDGYVSIDFLKMKTAIIRVQEGIELENPFTVTIDLGQGKGKRQVFIDNPQISESNAIAKELETFRQSIVDNNEPMVTIEDGYRSLELAYMIMNQIEVSSSTSVGKI